jgi:uncharacterized membrane protein YkvA (DUF1232 family)
MRWLVIGVLTMVAVWLIAVVVLLWMGRKTIAKELVTLVPNLLRLFRGLIGDQRVPWSSKALLVVGVLWLASPIDLIPEFVPGVGPIDDAVVASLVLRHLVKRAGPEVVREHWQGDPRTVGLILRAAGA